MHASQLGGQLGGPSVAILGKSDAAVGVGEEHWGAKQPNLW